MNDWPLVCLFLLVAAGASVVVLTRDPSRQAVTLSAYGVLTAVLMLALSAPDVAMSQLGVGVAVVPLLVVLTVAKCEREARDTHEEETDRSGDAPR